MVLLVPAHRQGKRLYVERVGEALAHDEGGESLEDASRTVHRPGDADGSEHQEQVVARPGDAFHAMRLERVDGFAKEPGDGQPDDLGEDEEDDEEHHLVTPPFGVAPESRVKLCYAAARKRIAHDQSTLLRSVGSSAISTRVRPRVVYCRTRALGFWKENFSRG